MRYRHMKAPGAGQHAGVGGQSTRFLATGADANPDKNHLVAEYGVHVPD